MYTVNGTVSHLLPLFGVIDNEDQLAGAKLFLSPNITSHLALVREDGSVAQFLSISSTTTTALEGPAEGMTSTYIGVYEDPTNSPNYSLQQMAQFINGMDFQGPLPESPGDLNNGIESYWRTVSAATITNIDVTCLSTNKTSIIIEFNDIYNTSTPYNVNISDVGYFSDVYVIDLGFNKYRTTIILSPGALEGQHFISLISQDDGNEAESCITYLALQSCGHPSDLDNDGLINQNDNCRYTYNPTQEDINNDGIGDACASLSGEGTGLIGLGTETPHSKLQVEEGDIYVENIYRGIILRSGNGTCYRIKPNDDGILITTEITCPE